MKSFLLFALLCLGATSLYSQNWIWAKSFGGYNVDPRDISIDYLNNIYFAMNFSDSIIIDQDTIFSAGDKDMLILKYDEDGTKLWSRNAGGSNIDNISVLVADPSGNIFLGGGVSDTAFFENDTLFSLGNRDGFVAKYSAFGNLQWTKSVAKSVGDIVISAMDLTPSGNLIVGGDYVNELIIENDTLNKGLLNADPNMFIAAFDGNGNKIWTEDVPVSGNKAKINTIRCSNNAIYVTGSFRGTVTFGSLVATSSGSDDVFVVKYDLNGNALWLRIGGAAAVDIGRGLHIDASENVYIAGTLQSTAFRFDSTGTGLLDSRLVTANSKDYYVAAYDSAGTLKWLESGGQGGLDILYSVAQYESTLFYAGRFEGTNAIFNEDTITTDKDDIFILRMDTSGNVLGASSILGSNGVSDLALRLSIDNNGNPITVGWFQSDTIFIEEDTLVNQFASQEAFLAKGCPQMEVDYFGLGNQYCINADSVQLTGSPGGGIFTGAGMSGDYFYPNFATAGIHPVVYTYTNANGCEYTKTYQTEVYDLTSITFTGLNSSYCIDAVNDTLHGNPIGGTFGGPGLTDSIIDIQEAGVGYKEYTYSFTDINGCSNVDTQSVFVYELPTLSLSGLNAKYCQYDENDTVHGFPSGGLFSSTSATIIDSVYIPNVIGNDTISYFYTDANGCSNTKSSITIVYENPSVAITPENADSAVCIGESMELAVNGARTYLWNTTSTSSLLTISPVVNTEYSVIGVDINGCYGYDTIIVSANSVPTLSLDTISPSCGQTDGSILALPVGGQGPPYNYLWSDDLAQTTATATNLGIGNYYVTVDDGKCEVVGSANLDERGMPAIQLAYNDTTICEGDTILLTSTDTIAKLSWNLGVLSGVDDYSVKLAPTSSVSYVVSRTDGSCTSIGVINISVLPKPIASIVADPDSLTLCRNESIYLTASGGNSYLWSTAEGTSSITKTPNTNSWYSVTVTALNGCTDADSVLVTVKSRPNANIQNVLPDYCKNAADFALLGNNSPAGTFTVDGIPAVNFSPSSLSTLSPHEVIYSYTDNYSCSNSDTIVVTINALPTVSFTNLNARYCNNADSIVLVGSPVGGTFTGTGVTNTNIFNPLALSAATHDINYTYTDGNGCTNVFTRNVQINALPNVQITGLNNSYCKTDANVTLTANISGGLFYIDNVIKSTLQPSSLTNGAHEVRYMYTDGNGCSNADTNTVVINSTNLAFLNLNDKYCENEPAITLAASPSSGTFYVNGGTTTTLNPATAAIGLNEVVYKYTNGETSCTDSIVAYVEVIDFPTNVGIVGLANEYCQGAAAVTLVGTKYPDGVFTIEGNVATTFNPSVLPADSTYRVVYTYANNAYCPDSAVKNVTIHSLPVVAIVSNPGIPHICEGESISLTATGGSSYSWSNGLGTQASVEVTPSINSSYSVTISDAHCSNVATSNVLVNEKPIVSFDTTYATCGASDASITTTVVGGITPLSFLWNTGETTQSLTGIGAGTYTLQVTDNESICDFSSSVTIDEKDVPVITIVPDATTVCLGESVTLTASGAGGAPYLWTSTTGEIISSTDATVVVNPSATGTYTAQRTNGLCTSTESQAITVLPLPNISFTTNSENASVCQNQSIQITASGGSTYLWSDGLGSSVSVTVAPTSSKKYYITVTGANSCVNNDSISVTVFALPSLAMANFPQFCLNDGSYTLVEGISPLGGIYSGNGVVNGVFNPSVAGVGSHSIGFTTNYDENGCRNSLAKNITVHNLPSAPTFSPISPLCVNGNSLVLTQGSPAGGTYEGVGIVADEFFPETAGVGTHTLTYWTDVDINGCRNNNTQDVVVNDTPAVAFAPVDAICVNEGTIDLLPYLSPSTGSLSGAGIDGYNFNPLLVGVGAHMLTYSYTDMNGCVNTKSRLVSVKPKTLIGFNSLPDLCENEVALTLSATPAGGIYSGIGIVGDSFNPANAGVGSHAIEYVYINEYNCSDTANQNITVNAVEQATFTAVPDLCENSNAHTLEASPIGGSFAGIGVSNGRFYPSIAGAGTYVLQYFYEGTNGCVDTAETSALINGLPTASASVLNQFISFGQSAQLQGIASGGSGEPFTYSWSPADSLVDAATTQNPNTKALTLSTLFELSVTDASGCNSNISQTIVNVVGSPLSVNTLGTTICANESDKIFAIVSGGSGNYSILWSPGIGLSDNTSQSPTVSGLLDTTTYLVRVVDNISSDTIYNTVVVNVNPLPVLSITPDTAICSGESVLLEVSGALNYSWNNGLSDGASHTVSPMYPSSYVVTGISNEGCSASISTTVGVNVKPNKPNVSYLGSLIACEGDSVILQGPESASYSYTWSNGDAESTSVIYTSGDYSLIVESDGGCISASSDTITIVFNTAPEKPIIDTIGNTILCAGDSVTLRAPSGAGLLYAWSTGEVSQSIEVGRSGEFYVQVENEFGCKSVNSDTTTIIKSIPVQAVVTNDIALCTSSEVQLIASGGAEYEWSNGSMNDTIVLTPTSDTVLYVTVTNALGCSDNDSISITIQENLVLDIGADTAVCAGQSLLLAANIGDEFAWSTGESTQYITYTPSDSAYVKVSVSLGSCVATDSILVEVLDVPTVNLGDDLSICGNDTLWFIGPQADEYAWNTGSIESSIFLIPSGNDTIVLEITNNGCRASDTVIVISQESIALDLGNDRSVCLGESITISANAGSEFIWSTGDQSGTVLLSPTASEFIYCTATSGLCTSIDSIFIEVTSVPVVSLGNDTTICEGNSILLDAGTAPNYRWSTGEITQSIEVSEAGTYAVSVTDNGCTGSDNIVISLQEKPTVTFDVTNATCSGATGAITAIVQGSGSYTYEWESTADLGDNDITSATITNLAVGLYGVNVTNGTCSELATVMLNDPNEVNPIDTIIADKNSICEGDTVHLTVQGTAPIYGWGPGNIVSATQGLEVNAYPTETTSIIVGALSFGGCQFYKEIIITVNEKPNINLPSDLSICEGESVVLSTSTFDSYDWSTGAVGSSIEVSEAGSYTLTATSRGCSSSDTTIVSLKASPQVAETIADSDCGAQTGSISLSGDLSYTYVWETGSNSTSIENIGAGAYSVQISNAECMVTNTYLVQENGSTDFSISVDGNVVASGTEVAMMLGERKLIELSGADSFEFLTTEYLTQNSNSSAIVSPRENTVYSIKGITSGCTKINTIGFAVQTTIAVDLGSDTSICSGTSIILDAGEYDAYLWNTGATTRSITVSEAGDYALEAWINDAKGIDVISVSLTDLTTVSYSVSNPTCSGGNGKVIISNPDNYNVYWAGVSVTNDTVTGVDAGVYSLLISEGECAISEVAVVHASDAGNLTVIPSTITVCEGEDATVTVSGGVGYTWYGNESIEAQTSETVNFIPVSSGNIVVQGTINGCISATTIPVEVVSLPNIGLPDSTFACEGTTATISTNIANASVLWSNGITDPYITVSTIGKYTVTVSKNGCSTADTTIFEYVEAPSTIVEVTEPGCGLANGSIAVNSGGENYFYTWSHTTSGAPYVYNLTKGIYTLTVYNQYCSTTRDIILNENGSPELTISPSSMEICEGETAQLFVTGSNNYIWTNSLGEVISSSNRATISPTNDEEYMVTTTVNGCSSTENASVTVHSRPILLFGNVADSYCSNGAHSLLSAFPSGGTFFIDTLATSYFDPSNYTAGLHNVSYSYTSQEGCVSTIEKSVEIYAIPEISLSNIAASICQGEELSPIANPAGGLFYINETPIDNFNYASLGHEDIIEVTYEYTDPSTACQVAVSETSKYFEKPTADFNYFLAYPDMVFLSITENASIFNWNFGDGTSGTGSAVDHRYNSVGDYTVTLSVANEGCSQVTTSKSITFRNTGINGIAGSEIRVSPTMTSEFITVEIEDALSDAYLIQIVSEDGKVILQDKLEDAQGDVTLMFEVKDFANGLYKLVISSNKEVFSKTFYKE